MGSNSKIEWTDATWNPTTGCSKTSPGCDHCYAIRVAKRLEAMGQSAYQGTTKDAPLNWTGRLNVGNRIAPLLWKKPQRIFVDSMSDLFHERMPRSWIHAAFAVMAACPDHTFQVLTKRPEVAAEYFRTHTLREAFEVAVGAENIGELRRYAQELEHNGTLDRGWPLNNVWLGTSVEDQQRAEERIPHLLETPAAVRFLSCEPLLGPVDLSNIPHTACGSFDALDGRSWDESEPDGKSHYSNGGIDWVIAGGESGPGARPMHPDWARGLRDQCQAAGVPFYFKQWGEWWPIDQMVDGYSDHLYHPAPVRDPQGIRRCKVATCQQSVDGSITKDFPPRSMMQFRVGKKAAGRQLDGRTWDEFPPASQETEQKTQT